MRSSAIVFLAAFIALSASWAGFVLAPQLQLGRAPLEKSLGTETLYPVARPGLAAQGAEVYTALGCVYCHSQQVGQDGVRCDIVLSEPGTNVLATLAALRSVDENLGKPETLANLPKVIKTVATVAAADAIVKPLRETGAKAGVKIVPTGSDISRGWGRRRTVAQDYAYDLPVQLGTRRAGPDLADVGARQPDIEWHLRHLYDPKSEVKDSTMPPYRFLFEERPAGKSDPADVLALPAGAAPAGKEIVKTDAARALAAYLVSLRTTDVPLQEAPFTPPPAPPAAPATNSAAQ
ncbi:MAG TPA: cbb3-type cytochrome c oxidase subunit II [Verrucomicrobiae bacterium]|nr:cbb3-type cytochrome c oxidase subunit II [Verrucomicrobiae bacterium]